MSVSKNFPKKIVVLSRRIKNSYWFIPTIMVFISVGGAFLSLLVDYSNEVQLLPNWAYLFSGGSDGARDVVGVIAGSVITVAGVTFSISIVILSLAAQQYGSRLLRNFSRDRALHSIMGAFISTFVFCLLILPSIHSGNDSGRIEFIPRFSVTICLLLAITCVFVLIYFIHHVSLTIQAAFLSSATEDELIEVLTGLYPKLDILDQTEQEPVDQANEFHNFQGTIPIHSRSSGYLQAVDLQEILELSSKNNFYFDIVRRPGEYIVKGDIILQIKGERKIDEHIIQRLIRPFTFGLQKTMDQDPGFGFDMLVEMALRALSPGINDPFTAIHCIEHLREGLSILATRPRPNGLYRDKNGTIRGRFSQLNFQEAMEQTIPRIEHYASSSPLVLRALADMIRKLSPSLILGGDKIQLKRHADRIELKLIPSSS